MRYNAVAVLYGTVFTKIVAKYYKANFPEIDFKALKPVLLREYKEMIARTPSIGGSKNSLEQNLIGACFFLAMGKVIPNMTVEIMTDIINKGIASPFMQKTHSGKAKKGVLFSDKTQNRKLEEAERSHFSPYEMDWRYDYVKGEDEFYCTYTKCGICTLAEKEGLEEFMPALCGMDFPMYELTGGKLYRTKTLANGDDCCNFHVVKIKDADKK